MRPWHLKHKIAGDKPWAVQIEAMRRSEGHDRYGMWMECGLGKTSLTLNEFVCDDDVDLAVVFAPNSFILDWALAPAEWGVPHIPGWVHRKHSIPFKEEVGLYAVNYEAARSGAFDDLLKLLKSRKCLLVIDEATAIMNPSSGISKGIRALAKEATKVRILNGTPLVKNVMDWYTPLRCLGQLDGWNPFQFKHRYAELGGFMGKQIEGVNPEREPELMRIVDSCSFRALKSEWRKDLPPQIVVDPVRVEMTTKQFKHYKEMMEQYFTIVSDLEVTADMVLVQYEKLRQLSSGLVMQDGKYEFIEEPSKNPKLQAALEIHQTGPGKTLLVHVYKPTGQALFDLATKAGLKPAVLKGSMKSEDLVAEKKRFNEDPDCRVMVCQERAACRGHTLIGGSGVDACTRTVFVENDFGLWERLQMNDRNYRGAQAEPCNIYDIVTSPMDMFAVETLRAKKEMADRVDQLLLMIKQRKR